MDILQQFCLFFTGLLLSLSLLFYSVNKMLGMFINQLDFEIEKKLSCYNIKLQEILENNKNNIVNNSNNNSDSNSDSDSDNDNNDSDDAIIKNESVIKVLSTIPITDEIIDNNIIDDEIIDNNIIDDEIMTSSLDLDCENNDKITTIINELKTIITIEDVREIFMNYSNESDGKGMCELINNKIHMKILNFMKDIESKNITYEEHVKYKRSKNIVIFD
jgi:hypothetical protein